MATKSPAQAINDNSLLLNRPYSDTGLPTGNTNIIGDGSTDPIDYYLEALQGLHLGTPNDAWTTILGDL